ncbi:MAG: response regulator [Kofleriaceae bacterium]|nr:response regulator [Kofleriaceae bacterium]
MTERPRPLVLIVEDDPDLLELERDALAEKGYRVATAANGEEGLERIAEEQPQLVLLDMRMPVMDGWTFARMLRDRYGRRIPLAVITAAEDSKLRADEIGADADLGKPFEMRELFELVADTIGDP